MADDERQMAHQGKRTRPEFTSFLFERRAGERLLFFSFAD